MKRVTQIILVAGPLLLVLLAPASQATDADSKELAHDIDSVILSVSEGSGPRMGDYSRSQARSFASLRSVKDDMQDGQADRDPDETLSRLRVSDNGRFLVKEDGSPFFWLGDTAWNLFQRTSLEDEPNQPGIERYFAARARQDFTVIQATLIMGIKPNAYGHHPFTAGDSPRANVKRGPDNDYWDVADRLIALGEKHGLYMALLPIWLSSLNDGDPIVRDPKVAYRYGYFLGNRYGQRTHIIWVLGGDPWGKDKDVDNPIRLAMTRALAEGIADGTNGIDRQDGNADYATTLMSFHPKGGHHSSSELLHAEPWLDFNMIQTTTHFSVHNYETVTIDYGKTPVKPTLNGEVAYENSLSLRKEEPQDRRITPSDVRRAAYWAVFAGGFGHTYGHRSFIQWTRKGENTGRGGDIPWYEVLDSPAANQMRHLRALIESRPFLSRVPDQGLLVGDAGTGVEHIRATRGEDYAFIYAPTGRPFTVRLGVISGQAVRASWFDPRIGKTEPIGTFANTGTREFVPPGRPGPGSDWVLVLDDAAREFPSSGSSPAEDLGERTAPLWQTLEWSVENPSWSGNQFDVVAKVAFVHGPSGRTRMTEMFFAGDHAWRFRFTGTQLGRWTFSTSSEDPELDGLLGTVIVEANPDPRAHGFMKAIANPQGARWGWEGTDEAFVPQYVMGKDLDAFYDPEHQRVDQAKIDRDIREFVDEHGFTGFHIQMRDRWFDLTGRTKGNGHPDRRTFDVLEALIEAVHARGGASHLWMWGKDQTRDGDGPRAAAGGPMSEIDRRNLRYIAARLGPIPGWSIGYGYDTENLWAGPEELDAWKQFLEEHSGWSHFIGARVGFDEKGPYGQYGRNRPKPKLDEKFNAPIGDEYTAWLGGNYTGYTSYRPLYDRYVAVLEHQPQEPSFEEDRFRIRDAAQWTHKDYDPELVRKGLWHSAMAGGVANIWGHLLPSDDQGGSQSYDHGNVHIKDQIKTYATFFRDKGRFRKDLIRDNSVADPRTGTTEVPQPADISVCLRDPGRTHYVFYKENCFTLGMDLSGIPGSLPAVAVDARAAYREIDLGRLPPGRHRWEAPYRSDWAVAVGDF